MNRCWAGILCLVPFASPVMGEVPSPPQQGVALATAEGRVKLTMGKSIPEMLTYQSEYTVLVPRKTVVKVVKDGVEVEQEKTEQVPETRTMTHAKTVFKTVWQEVNLDPATTKFFETNGAAVPAASIAGRLSKPTLVVFLPSGKPLAPVYAWAFKPGTLVVSTTAALGAPPLPAPPAEDAGELPTSVETEEAEPPKAEDEAKPKAEPVVPEAVPEEPKAPRVGDLQLPSRPAPGFRFASLDREGLLNLRSVEEKAYKQKATREVSVPQGDSQVTKLVAYEFETVTTTGTTAKVAPENLRLFQADNRAVEPKRLASVLTSEQPAVVSTDGNLVDVFWLKNLNPWVLIVIAPPEVCSSTTGCYPMPGPVMQGPLPTAPPAPAAPVPVPAPRPPLPKPAPRNEA